MKSNNSINENFIEPGVSSQAQKILERLKFQFSSFSERCYLLLDPFLRDFYDDDVVYERIDNKEAMPISIPHSSVDKSRVPLIIPLDLNSKKDEALLFHSIYESLLESHPRRIERGNGRRFCAWLAVRSGISLSDLAGYIGKTAIQKVSIDKTILLRLYDPAVFSQLWLLLSDVQRRTLLGFVSEWNILASDGDIQTFTPPPVGFIGAHSLAIPNEQYRKIRVIGAINQGLCAYRQINDGLWIDDKQAQRLLFPLFDRTRDYQFNSRSEWADMAVKALTIHPFFDRHKLLAARADRMYQSIVYSDWIHGISPKEWEMVREECIARYGSVADLLIQN